MDICRNLGLLSHLQPEHLVHADDAPLQLSSFMIYTLWGMIRPVRIPLTVDVVGE